MPFYVWLAAIAIIGSLPLLVWSLRTTNDSEAQENLFSRGGGSYRNLQLGQPVSERVFAPLVSALASRGRRLTTDGMVNAINRRIELAGLSGDWTVEKVLALKVGLTIAGGVIGFGRLAFGTVNFSGILLGTLLATVGYLGPSVWLSRRAAERQLRIQQELPDTIDQVTIGVEAGLAFDTALSKAAHNGIGPLAEEMLRTLRDIQLGVPRDIAFDRLLDRTEVRDLQQVVIAIRQADRYGIPIARTLRTQTDELREKRRSRAEEQAMKVPVKIVFPLVFCILPALFVVVLGPAVIDIFDSI